MAKVIPNVNEIKAMTLKHQQKMDREIYIPRLEQWFRKHKWTLLLHEAAREGETNIYVPIDMELLHCRAFGAFMDHKFPGYKRGKGGCDDHVVLKWD